MKPSDAGEGQEGTKEVVNSEIDDFKLQQQGSSKRQFASKCCKFWG